MGFCIFAVAFKYRLDPAATHTACTSEGPCTPSTPVLWMVYAQEGKKDESDFCMSEKLYTNLFVGLKKNDPQKSGEQAPHHASCSTKELSFGVGGMMQGRGDEWGWSTYSENH